MLSFFIIGIFYNASSNLKSFYLELSANDYVEPGYESQNTVTVIGDSAAGKYYTYFTGYLIG